MCYRSNALYNCCLYAIKTHFKETTKYIGLNPLYHFIKTNEHLALFTLNQNYYGAGKFGIKYFLYETTE